MPSVHGSEMALVAHPSSHSWGGLLRHGAAPSSGPQIAAASHPSGDSSYFHNHPGGTAEEVGGWIESRRLIRMEVARALRRHHEKWERTDKKKEDKDMDMSEVDHLLAHTPLLLS